jgi:BlaI family transcriptional regulator, penicillinase repressor
LTTPTDVQYNLHIDSEASKMSTFTPGELIIMRLLWEHGELKPSELQRLYPEPIKNPALRSYLTILLKKRHVARRKDGKAYVYRAVTRRQFAFSSKLHELVDGFCNGSMQSLLLNLIRAEAISEEELVKLKQLADENPPSAPTEPSPSAARPRRANRKRKKT